MMKKTVVGDKEKEALERKDVEVKERTEKIKQYVLDKNKTRQNIFIPDVPDSFNKLITNKKIIGPALIKVYINLLASTCVC
jgi:hypothetical protein